MMLRSIPPTTLVTESEAAFSVVVPHTFGQGQLRYVFNTLQLPEYDVQDIGQCFRWIGESVIRAAFLSYSQGDLVVLRQRFKRLRPYEMDPFLNLDNPHVQEELFDISPEGEADDSHKGVQAYNIAHAGEAIWGFGRALESIITHPGARHDPYEGVKPARRKIALTTLCQQDNTFHDMTLYSLANDASEPTGHRITLNLRYMPGTPYEQIHFSYGVQAARLAARAATALHVNGYRLQRSGEPFTNELPPPPDESIQRIDFLYAVLAQSNRKITHTASLPAIQSTPRLGEESL